MNSDDPHAEAIFNLHLERQGFRDEPAPTASPAPQEGPHNPSVSPPPLMNTKQDTNMTNETPAPAAPQEGTPRTDDEEAKYRAEWLHEHKAPSDWIVLRDHEVQAIKQDLAACRAERDRFMAHVEKVEAENSKIEAHAETAREDLERMTHDRDGVMAINEKHRATLAQRDAEVAMLRAKVDDLSIDREHAYLERLLGPTDDDLRAERDALAKQVAEEKAKVETPRIVDAPNQQMRKEPVSMTATAPTKAALDEHTHLIIVQILAATAGDSMQEQANQLLKVLDRRKQP